MAGVTAERAARRAKASAPPAATAIAAATASHHGISVVGPAAGRRRAGIAFGLEPIRLSRDVLSEEELAAIAGDPVLTVTDIVFEDAAPS